MPTAWIFKLQTSFITKDDPSLQFLWFPVDPSYLLSISSWCLSRLVLCSMNSLGAELLKMGLNLPSFPTHTLSHFPPAIL